MSTIAKNTFLSLIIVFSVITSKPTMAQEEADKDKDKLEYTVAFQEEDSIYADGQTRLDLIIDVDSKKIDKIERLYVQVSAGDPKQIYFIRGIDSEVLTGEKSVELWEEEKAEKEKEWEEERFSKIEKEEDKIKRYEKQEGKQLKIVENEDGMIRLVFGSFDKGTYNVHVMIRDKDNNLHYQDQQISLL